MVFKITKRNMVRLVSFTLALIVAGFGGWIYSDSRVKKLRREVVHKYEASLEEVADGIKNISVLLNKSLYVGTAYGMCSLTGELEALAGSIEGAMASFPSNIKGSDEIAKFVNQVSDFSSVLLKQSVAGKEITNEERTSLKSLAKSADNINKHLDEALSVYNTSENWQNRVEGILEGIEVDDGFTDSLSQMADILSSSPTLIYDGPFSDHIDDKESLLLKNKEQITVEKAKEIALKHLYASGDSLELSGEEAGKIPSFCFSNEESYISVAKNGGFVNYFRKSRSVSDSKLTTENAVATAQSFLREFLGKEFVQTYYFTEENVCVINFAFVQGEVVCYPDLIKVGVAMDNGEIVFYEARGYIMNHAARTFETPKYSLEQARGAVSEYLEIISEKLVIIPTGSKGEKLCYEFLCKGENQEEILVYINVDTLAEENIFILVKTEGGTLTE